MPECTPQKGLYSRVHACLWQFFKLPLVKTSRFCEGVGVLASPCRQDRGRGEQGPRPLGAVSAGVTVSVIPFYPHAHGVTYSSKTLVFSSIFRAAPPARARARDGQERKIAFFNESKNGFVVGPCVRGMGSRFTTPYPMSRGSPVMICPQDGAAFPSLAA